MKTASILLFISILIIGFIYLLKGYKSAFEADQACHAQIAQENELYSQKINCDHDIETRQWILYQEGLNNSAAKVIRRYRY